MRVYIFGNQDLEMDSLPIRLIPALTKSFPEHEFLTQDPNEEWHLDEPFWIIDTVVGLKAPRVFDSIDAFIPPPVVTMHDFDAYTNLRFLKKLGKLPAVNIIGLPVGISEDDAVGVVKLLL